MNEIKVQLGRCCHRFGWLARWLVVRANIHFGFRFPHCVLENINILPSSHQDEWTNTLHSKFKRWVKSETNVHTCERAFGNGSLSLIGAFV